MPKVTHDEAAEIAAKQSAEEQRYSFISQLPHLYVTWHKILVFLPIAVLLFRYYDRRNGVSGKVGVKDRMTLGRRFLQKREQELAEKPNIRKDRFLNTYIDRALIKQLMRAKNLDKQARQFAVM